MKPFRFPQCLFAAALLAASAQAQTLDAIVMPPPEAPAVTQEAQGVLAAVNKRVPQIDTAGLVAQLKAQPETVVIDVRTAAELEMMGGYIDAPRFFNLPRGWLEFQIETAVPDKNTPIVVYCGVSQRSPLAADTLIKLGYKNVKNYRDGYFNWQRAGLPTLQLDKAPASFLYDLPQEVIPGVWSAIGATAPGTYVNSGHNNNLSFVITDDGVLVVNAGDNYLLAQSLHEEIKKHTTQPVKYVVLENSQGHAMLGSNYWKEQGATIIAHRDTAKQMEATGYDVLAGMRNRARDKAFKTEFVMPDTLYDDKLELKMGSWNLQILHLGPSHSHGDTMVWLPEKKLVIAGDTAFHIRMLPIFEDTDTAKWIETWDLFEALGAEIVIPGHGGPTDMATVRKWTRDYLVHLREKVAEVVKAGGSLDDAYQVDQSAYLHLHTADELARSNAGRVFRAMEFE
ncbi:MAG TPA: rhodanese-like domain-containing protein [Thiobacillus sp.]|nr:rhodanese-like domain-containing protein [Thiobacillus sp.]